MSEKSDTWAKESCPFRLFSDAKAVFILVWCYNQTMKQKQAFVFDFDGTLVDSNDLEKESMVKTIQTFADPAFRPETIFDYYGPTEDGILKRLIPKENIEKALPFFLDTYEKMQDRFLHTFDGMEDVLAMIKENGKRLFLLTGRSEKTLKLTLGKIGYAPCFEAFYTGSDAGVNKPDSMRRLLRENGLNPEDVLYVGDSLEDIRSMTKAGVDLLSAGYSHDEDYVEKLEKNNPGNVVRSVDALRKRIQDLF